MVARRQGRSRFAGRRRRRLDVRGLNSWVPSGEGVSATATARIGQRHRAWTVAKARSLSTRRRRRMSQGVLTALHHGFIHGIRNTLPEVGFHLEPPSAQAVPPILTHEF